MANEENTNDFVDGRNFACDDYLEVESDYEFGAPCFFDFTRSETNSELREAQAWFDHADSYPPSPFVMKLILEKLRASQHANLNISNSESKPKMVCKPAESRSLSYMKPTASLLAKQNKLQEANCKHLYGRHNKSPVKSQEKSLSSPRYEGLLPKRQKVERRYLWKVAQLKRQSLLQPKIYKNVATNLVTIAKGPQLQTMRRAEKRSTKNTSESSENANSKVQAVEAQPQSQNRNEYGTSNEEILLQISLIEKLSELSVQSKSENKLTRPSPYAKASFKESNLDMSTQRCMQKCNKLAVTI